MESPAGVGYSYNDGSEFEYSDATTLEDNLQALLSFYQNYPEYAKNGLWLSGESYAGKYIPDLAVAIDYYNQQDKSTPINLLGLLVGNGIMSFEQG